MSAKSPQTVRRPVPRRVVIALEGVNCGTITRLRRVRRGPEIASQPSPEALEAQIGSTPSFHRQSGRLRVGVAASQWLSDAAPGSEINAPSTATKAR